MARLGSVGQEDVEAGGLLGRRAQDLGVDRGLERGERRVASDLDVGGQTLEVAQEVAEVDQVARLARRTRR